jgi:hypothetical protein
LFRHAANDIYRSAGRRRLVLLGSLTMHLSGMIPASRKFPDPGQRARDGDRRSGTRASILQQAGNLPA